MDKITPIGLTSPESVNSLTLSGQFYDNKSIISNDSKGSQSFGSFGNKNKQSYSAPLSKNNIFEKGKY
jgi:hypothetical protein